MKNAALPDLNFKAALGVVEGAGADVEPDADAATDARVEVTTEEVAGKDVGSVPTSTVKYVPAIMLPSPLPATYALRLNFSTPGTRVERLAGAVNVDDWA